MGDNLDLLAEKTRASVIRTSLQTALMKWLNLELTDYTCTDSVNLEQATGDESSMLYYLIFLEVLNDTPVTAENTAELDDLLHLNQEEYDGCRKNDTFKQLRIIQVKSGTFEKFKQFLISSNPNASFAQLKIPRVIRREEHICFMIDGAM